MSAITLIEAFEIVKLFFDKLILKAVGDELFVVLTTI